MNSINYYKRYIKYKKKYLEKKNNLIGGYKLSDKTKGRILDTVLSNILKDCKNVLYFKFDDQGKKNDGYGFDETLEYLSNDKDYNSILPYLLEKYMNEKPYTQIFYKENCEIISEFRNMIPYHVNIGALMFLSFITELEIFTLFHSIIPFNTSTEVSRNSLNTAFCNKADEGICTKTRIYKDNVNEDILNLFTNFTKVLDETFTMFMNLLLIIISTSLIQVDIKIIRNCIVPLESSIYNKDNKWDYIFADWKNRLGLLYKNTTKEEKESFELMTKINEAIIKTLNINRNKLLNYIAEATGFFSYIYLINPEKKDKYFGSCITYSMFELYIMSRLHTRGENMILLVEKETKDPHRYWKITQERTNIPTLSHFATKFILGKKSYILRSIYEKNGLNELSFRDNKPKILKIFIYLIYDMYIQYFNNLDSDLKKLHGSLLEKIKIFINERITSIEKKIGCFVLNINTVEEIKEYLENLFTESISKIVKIDIDSLFKKSNILEALLSFDEDNLFSLLWWCLIEKNFYLILQTVKIYPNISLYKKKKENYNLLDYIFLVEIENINDNDIVIELIDELLRKGCIITTDLREISKKNIKLYIILKQKFNIPNLTLNDLIQFILMDIKPYQEYIINELLLNECLIQQFNDTKIEDFSLLYTIFLQENWLFLSILIKINKILKKSSIDFNIKNKNGTNLFNLIQLKYSTIIKDYIFHDDRKIVDSLIIILKHLGY